MITFGQARELVRAEAPDYKLATYGYEGDADWFVFPFPETAGGRIAAVGKDTGSIRWINENANEYNQNRPAGDWPQPLASSSLHVFHLPGQHDQSTHGHGGGLRDSLASAKTTEELNAAIKAEVTRLTGRGDVSVDMSGLDLEVGKEYAEGVLRGVERFPNAKLRRIGSDSLSGPMAQTRALGDGYEVVFDSDPGWRNRKQAALFREDLEMSHRSGRTVFSGPIGVGAHEYGHVVANSTPGTLSAVAGRAQQWGEDRVAQRISEYATTSRGELAAESFADVIMNGTQASSFSQAVFGIIDSHYRRRS